MNILERLFRRTLADPFTSFGSQAEAIHELRRSNEFWRERFDEMVGERDEAIAERDKLRVSFDAAADRAESLQALADSRLGEIDDLNKLTAFWAAEMDRLRPLAEFGQKRKDALARAWRKKHPVT